MIYVLFALILNGKTIPETTFNNMRVVSIKELRKAFDFSTKWIDKKKKLVIKGKNRVIVIIPFNRNVVVNKQGIHVPYEIQWNGKDFFIPVKDIPYIFNNSKSKKGIDVRIEKILFKKKGNGIVLSFISGKKELKYSVKKISYTKIQIILNGKYSGKKPEKIGFIKKVSISSDKGHTKLILITSKKIDITSLKDGVFLLTPKKSKKMIVVLDPGHGGRDPGAIGKNGTKEKVVVLKVAKYVKEYLEEAGITVYMTRNKDSFVRLKTRAKFANRLNADIFVSIHANSAPAQPKAKGLETYFLAAARTSWQRAVALRENGVVEKYETKHKSKDDIALILSDMAQNEYLNEASLLAEYIQESATSISGIKNRGLNQAGFYVLRFVYMPSVLVEIGFLSNRVEEKKLNEIKIQKKIAKGIAKGIIRFLKEYKKKLNV